MRDVRRISATLPRTVLVDTGGFYALTDVHDAYHVAANDLLNAFAIEHVRLFTTDFIVAESHALILARLRRIDLALAFLNTIYESERTMIVPVTAEDKRSALRLLNQYADKRFSFTDATSFVVMERLGISHAFTFDQNFVQYGFTILPTPT